MTWFSARLLFECDVQDGQDRAVLCEESIRLIEAENVTEAQAKALELGKQEEHYYKNEAGAIVKWKFEKILEVQDLCEPRIFHGVEVFSRIFRKGSLLDEGGDGE